MEHLEQKLKAYYENDPGYVQSEAFVERMKALETDRKAKIMPFRIRRYVPAVAALIAFALLLGTGWAWYRTRQPGKAPAPGTSQEHTTLSQPDPQAPGKTEPPAPAKPETPGQGKPDVPAPAGPERPVPSGTEEPAPSGQEGPALEAREAQTPAKPEGSAPSEREDPVPPEPDDPVPLEPDNPVPPEPDDPVPPEPDGPVPPPEEPYPPAEDPQDPDIGAVYRMDGDQELLTMTLLSTGESVDVDVTGWEDQAASGSPGQSAAYTGRNPVVNYIFDKDVTFSLTRGDDGTVRVELEVDELEN